MTKVSPETKSLLHSLIAEGDEKRVINILNQNPKEKRFLHNGVTAAAFAIRIDELQMYKILVSRRVCVGLKEDMDELVKDLSEASRQEISEINKKYCVMPNLKHLKTLYLKSKVTNNVPDAHRPPLFERIEKAYHDLNRIKEIEAILKFVATAEKLNIMFDFNKNSVNHMNPTVSKNCTGLCVFEEGELYFGANGLTFDQQGDDESKRLKTLGVIAHEFCHMAMSLIYNNKCKPYSQNDRKAKEKFDEIFKLCEERKGEEEIMSWVFNENYTKDEQIDELIVRVPHILAVYQNRESELKEKKETFKELFEFYDNYVLRDIKLEIWKRSNN